MSESAKRHEENSNLIKEIRASMDAAIRNQGALIKTLEIQIGQMSKEDKKEDRWFFKCGDPNHFISDCPKNSFNDQKAFVAGCWSDRGDDKEEICLMAYENEVLSDTPYYSSSSLDNESRQNEYDKLCKASLRIINKNKHLKAKNELLQRNVDELKIKLELLEKNKEISNKCDVCNKLEIEINSLKLKLASFENSSSSLRKMVEMQNRQKTNMD
ncbi:hypothetical protein Tco_1437041 [Tanacetum coccineum]